MTSPKLQVLDEGAVVVDVGLSVTLYFHGGHLPIVREAVLGCAGAYLQAHRTSLRWVKDPATFRFHRIDAPVPGPTDWLAGLPPNEAWELEWHGGHVAAEASPFHLQILGRADRGKDELSYIKAGLSADDAVPFLNLVRDFAARLKPFHGYGGLTLLESPDEAIASRHEPEVRRMAERHAGLDVDAPTSHLLWLKKGVKGAQWLVVLSDSWVARLGDAASLLASSFSSYKYEGGVVLRAGDAPCLGGAPDDPLLKAYAQLARLLKPIRAMQHRGFHHGGPDRFDRETSERWLARFDI